MKRITILEVPLVLLAAILVGIIGLVFWLIMLVPYLVKPQLTKPVTDKLSEQFTKQIAGMMTRGRRTKHVANVGQLLLALLSDLGRPAIRRSRDHRAIHQPR